MPCESCYSKDEIIRELEAKVRRLESMKEPIFPVKEYNYTFSGVPEDDIEMCMRLMKK